MNDQPALADLDLDSWIDGTCGITGTARIVQKGDLIAVRDRLENELRNTKKIPLADRSLVDRAPETIQAELDRVNEQLYQSMLVVTLQDRTNDRRRKLREKLMDELKLDPKKQDDIAVLNLYEMADAIIKVETAEGKEIPLGPNGFGGERLVKIRERCGEAALIELADRYYQMTSSAPAVMAPLSRSSSSGRGGAI